MSLSARVLADIIPSEELSDMGRRRYQQPSVFRTKGKRPMWYFRAREDTKRTRNGDLTVERAENRHYIGYVDEMTKQDAKKRRDEMLAEVINVPQVLITSQVKFSEVLTVYKRDHVSTLRETTRATEESFLRKIEPTLGKLRMCDITTVVVQQWLSGMDLAYKTKRNYLGRLRLIWRCAEDWGYTQKPFPRSRYSLGVNRSVKGQELPSMDQIRRLLVELQDPYRAMAEIAMFTGLRISEIRGLKWADLGTDRLTVRRRLSVTDGVDVPKNSQSRFFDTRALKLTFGRLERKGDWIFGAAGSYSTCRAKISAAAAAAGITSARFGWHHLRAVFNTLARLRGADAVDRQALMGHSDERMNAVYVMQDSEEVKRRGDLMLAVHDAVMGATGNWKN